MDRKESVAALGHGLLSAKQSQIAGMIEKYITSAKNFKLLEREAIKEALEAAVFDFFEEVSACKAETQRLWEENKKKSGKGKDKVIQTAHSKNSDNTIPAPNEKLLGSSIRVETARLSREAEKRPHIAEEIALTPPPRAAPAPVDDESSFGDDNRSSSENETSDVEPLSDAPGTSKTIT
ncbi:hypothetical protein R1sor_018367 [Riccia sorocarpa]|uniref:Uncharacterized protein n=1 Tax=Riccia sorocarpa TaxID=122646 RepID=A0ABD3ID23_9MARC